MPSIFEYATQPLIPKDAIRGVQDRIDPRSLTQSPAAARVRGFGAGALEGLRGLLTPANLALAAVPMLAAGRGVPAAMQGLAEVAPTMGRTTTRVLPAMETLGETMAEFTPRGGEALYNIGKRGMGATRDVVNDSMVTKYLTRMK
jgi:hypothetical protein